MVKVLHVELRTDEQAGTTVQSGHRVKMIRRWPDAKLKPSTAELTSHVLLTEHLELPAEDPMRQYAHVTIYKQRRSSTTQTLPLLITTMKQISL